MSNAEEEHARLEGIAESFSTFEGKDVHIVRYTARAVIDRCRGGRTLEVACADGAMAVELSRAFPDLTILDGSRTLLDRALSRVPDARGIHSLIEDFEPETPFDAVIACHVLEHVERPLAALESMKRALAVGGELHIVVPNCESINRRIGLKLGMLTTLDQLTAPDFAVGHRRIYSEVTLDAVIAAAGLTIVQKRGIMLKPLSNSQMLDWPPDLLDAFYELGFEMPVSMCSQLYYVLSHARTGPKAKP